MDRLLLHRFAPLVLLATLAGLILPAAPAAARHNVSAGCDVVRLPAATPIGVGRCPGVRPGGFLETPIGGCTFNFLFKGSDGNRYIGTAGHCLLSKNGEKTWKSGGPIVKVDDKPIGRGAYAIFKNKRDFALIRLSRRVRAGAQMCHFGGPVALDRERLRRVVTLEHYGNGIGLSALTPARTAVASDTADPDRVMANGVAIFGDSGSGVMRDGKAIGVVVAIGFGTSRRGSPGIIFITRLGPQLELAQEALRAKMTLKKAQRL